MQKLNRINKILVLMLALLPASIFANGNGAPAEGAQVNIRVYCFYIPKDKLKATGPEQLSSATYVKLMKDVGSRKISARYKQNVFSVSEKEYNDLFKDCQSYVTTEKGQVLDLKGTDASYPETVTRFYRISVTDFEEPSEAKKVLLLDDTEVLNKLGINPADANGLAEILSNKDNQVLLQKLVNKVGKAELATLVRGARELAGNSYVQNALMIAAILALAWFGPAYVAGAVDLIYPMVYGALFGGVPSKWGLAYWLVYYPGKQHAVAWAYANSGAIITAVGTLAQGGWNFAQKFRSVPAANSALKEVAAKTN